MTAALSCYTLILCFAASAATAHQSVNAGASTIQDFEKRIAAYLKLRKEWTKGTPALKTSSAEALSKQSAEVSSRIRAGRAGAKQGEFFTPSIRAEFLRLIQLAMSGPDAANIRKTLNPEEPALLRLRVNETYPSSVPLEAASPGLLMNLPKLPSELEYRVVSRNLVLRDVDANLIVDYMTGIVR
jgi:hypothetical protein